MTTPLVFQFSTAGGDYNNETILDIYRYYNTLYYLEKNSNDLYLSKTWYYVQLYRRPDPPHPKVCFI